jgi:ABC-type nitrate/sulfonate/bicarbonate transport system substrate-binding protein
MKESLLDTLWYTRCSVPTPVGLAVQLGWFERAFAPDGVVIKSVRDSDDRTVRESHFDHNQKHSVRQGGSVPPIWARAEGRDTRVIGLLWTEETQQILTLPESGIRNVKDLKGRKLGLPRHKSERFPRLDVRGATALRGYDSALGTQGLSLGDVELVELHENGDPFAEKRPAGRRTGSGYDNEVFALVRGEVDAIFVKGARGQEVRADLGPAK